MLYKVSDFKVIHSLCIQPGISCSVFIFLAQYSIKKIISHKHIISNVLARETLELVSYIYVK